MLLLRYTRQKGAEHIRSFWAAVVTTTALRYAKIKFAAPLPIVMKRPIATIRRPYHFVATTLRGLLLKDSVYGPLVN